MDDSKFLSADRSILSSNLFSYCKCNPINFCDSNGNWVVVALCAIALIYFGGCLLHSLYNLKNAPSDYIYNQTKGKASKMWFGMFKSSYNGCGWIATHNALIMLGKKPKPADIIAEYELSGAVLLGVFGIQPYAISTYFKVRGYKVKITYNSSKFNSVAKSNKANIIWYWHSKGAHYVALKWDGKKFKGYNTFTNSSGPDDWGSSITSFLKNHNYTASLMISIS